MRSRWPVLAVATGVVATVLGLLASAALAVPSGSPASNSWIQRSSFTDNAGEWTAPSTASGGGWQAVDTQAEPDEPDFAIDDNNADGSVRTPSRWYNLFLEHPALLPWGLAVLIPTAGCCFVRFRARPLPHPYPESELLVKRLTGGSMRPPGGAPSEQRELGPADTRPFVLVQGGSVASLIARPAERAATLERTTPARSWWQRRRVQVRTATGRVRRSFWTDLTNRLPSTRRPAPTNEPAAATDLGGKSK